MAFKIKLEGFDESLRKLEDMDRSIKEEVDFELRASLVEMQNEIIRRAPIGKSGFLHSTIVLSQLGERDYVLEAKMKYAAFLNWGTITRVKVETFWKEYAMLFKGKGIRKTGGIKPTFFFTGPVDRRIPKIIERIKQIINK